MVLTLLINKKMDFLFNDLGEQTVKDNKFHAFDVVIDDSHKRTVKTKSKSKTPLVAVIALALIFGLLVFIILPILLKKNPLLKPLQSHLQNQVYLLLQ